MFVYKCAETSKKLSENEQLKLKTHTLKKWLKSRNKVFVLVAFHL